MNQRVKVGLVRWVEGDDESEDSSYPSEQVPAEERAVAGGDERKGSKGAGALNRRAGLGWWPTSSVGVGYVSYPVNADFQFLRTPDMNITQGVEGTNVWIKSPHSVSPTPGCFLYISKEH